jgi:oligopeptide/dipeptide ABC transporter ATP-binding protein
MYLGRIVEVAPAHTLIAAPRHPYTKALLSAVPQVHAAGRPTRIRLAGEPPSPLNPPPGCRFHPRCPHAEPRCRTTAPMLSAVAAGHEVACHVFGGVS